MEKCTAVRAVPGIYRATSHTATELGPRFQHGHIGNSRPRVLTVMDTMLSLEITARSVSDSSMSVPHNAQLLKPPSFAAPSTDRSHVQKA